MKGGGAPRHVGFLFLDIEASSLDGQSYPIELAWIDEAGKAESDLIRPLESWTDWSDDAEALHGIARARLMAEGRTAGDVAARLEAACATRTLVSDGPEFDRIWLAALFACAGHRPPPVQPVQAAYAEALAGRADFTTLRADHGRKATQLLIACEEEEAARDRPRHRALADAAGLRWTWLRLKEAPAP